MKTASVKCIILGHKNIGEADKFVFLYSSELGKIRTIAKGARKITSKFTGHLETLNYCTASLYFGPRNIILREIITEKNLVSSKSNLSKISNALKIAEATNKNLFDNQTLDNLIPFIIETLNQLKITTRPNLIRIAYIIKLLDKTGVVPDFTYNPTLSFIKNKPLKEIEHLQISKKDAQKINKIVTSLTSF